MASTRRGLSAELFCIISMISSRQFLHLTHAFSRSSSSRPFHGEFCPNRASVSRLTEVSGSEIFSLPLLSRVSAVLLANKKDRSVETTEMSFLNVILSDCRICSSACTNGFNGLLRTCRIFTSAIIKDFNLFF